MKLLREYIRSLLTESPRSGDFLLPKIELAQEAFGEGNLAGGNCGTFAMALAAICEDEGVPFSFGIVFEDTDPPAEELVELTEAEPDVYHIILESGGVWYDGGGTTNVNELLSIAGEYGDSEPGFFDEIFDMKMMGRIVRNETNWDISTPRFYTTMTGGGMS
jgi:hypothetical protein